MSRGANPVIDGASTGGTIGWSLDSGAEAFDYLAAGETLVLDYTLQASDGTASDTETVTVTVTGKYAAEHASAHAMVLAAEERSYASEHASAHRDITKAGV